MTTTKENTRKFLGELDDLLLKYKAELSVVDTNASLSYLGSDLKINLTIEGEFDKNGNCLREYVDINLEPSLPRTLSKS
jgi:hypothetical protein